jgi:outer membrane beta-barrel protein
MIQRILFGLALAGTLLATDAIDAPEASAQDVQITGPLAGAPACRHCRIYRELRFQVQPFVGFTLQDEFTRTIPVGLQLQFHFTDWLGLGVWGAWAGLNLDTGLTDEVQTQGQTTDRNRLSLPCSERTMNTPGHACNSAPEGFPDQIGRMQWLAAAQLTFIPLRGKLSLFQKLFIDADFYIAAGVALVGVEERAEVLDTNICATAGAACVATQSERESRIAFAPTFAVGLMLYATDFFGVSFEWRALPFSWNTSGTDEGRDGGEFPDRRIDANDRTFHFNHMVNIGFSFFLPPAAKISD